MAWQALQIADRTPRPERAGMLKDYGMKLNFKIFGKDDTGAITVDWVVLSAAIIGLGMVVLIPIAYSSDSAADGVADYIANVDVGYENQ
jgi:hypothetical protein